MSKHLFYISKNPTNLSEKNRAQRLHIWILLNSDMIQKRIVYSKFLLKALPTSLCDCALKKKVFLNNDGKQRVYSRLKNAYHNFLRKIFSWYKGLKRKFAIPAFIDLVFTRLVKFRNHLANSHFNFLVRKSRLLKLNFCQDTLLLTKLHDTRVKLFQMGR